MKDNFLDLICEIMMAGEDEREIFLIQNGDVEWCNDVEMLMGALYKREEKFISCKLEGSKLNCIFKNEEFAIDIF